MWASLRQSIVVLTLLSWTRGGNSSIPALSKQHSWTQFLDLFFKFGESTNLVEKKLNIHYRGLKCVLWLAAMKWEISVANTKITNNPLLDLLQRSTNREHHLWGSLECQNSKVTLLANAKYQWRAVRFVAGEAPSLSMPNLRVYELNGIA